MMTSYGDTDVQDKATFYYSLITKATDKKVQSVLKTSLGDVESMNQTITSLLPGTTEKLSLAKIIHLEEQVFYWERVSVTTSVNRKDTSESQKSAKDSTGEDPIVQYEEDLRSLSVILDVRCKLTMREDADYERVHAVSIHVEPSDFFHPVQRRHVSCLKKSVSTEVTLQVQPKLPLPQSLCCRAEFCNDSKQTYSSNLAPVALEFSNLLMPLPWKPEKEVDFTSFWNWVLNRNTGERGSIASVKMFTMGPEKFDQIQNTHLSKFLIPTDADKCYALFLPPENHVLLRCQAQSSNSIVVSLATDLWKLLPHIDKYLNNIMQ